VAAAESFDTTRKSGWIAESLAVEPIEGVDVVVPAPLRFEDIAAVHERTYVNAVLTGEPRRLAQAQGFEWDPGMWLSVTASNGGVVAAARAAIAEGVAGSLSSGLHHARFESGRSFCTFNGLVVAAGAVLADGVKSVLVLDLDAHCGGGTHSLIADDPRIRQVDISVCPVDTHRPAGENVCEMITDSRKYLGAIEKQLEVIDRSGWMPGLCLYNAGMDPVETCGIGGLPGISPGMLREREVTVFEWLAQRGIPVAFVLAGGYSAGRLSREGLVALHRHTIEEAARRAPARPKVRSSDVSCIMSVPGQPVPR